jgi:hypothetical protein
VPNGCLVAQSPIESDTLSAASANLVRDLVDRQRRRIRIALDGTPHVSDGELDDLASFVVATNATAPNRHRRRRRIWISGRASRNRARRPTDWGLAVPMLSWRWSPQVRMRRWTASRPR